MAERKDILEKVEIMLNIDTSNMGKNLQYATQQMQKSLNEQMKLWANAQGKQVEVHKKAMDRIIKSYNSSKQQMIKLDEQFVVKGKNKEKEYTDWWVAELKKRGKYDLDDQGRKLRGFKSYYQRKKDILDRFNKHRKAVAAEQERDEKKAHNEAIKREKEKQRAANNSIGGRMQTAIGNVVRYSTAGFVSAPYLMALGAIGKFLKDTTVGAIELNKELYKLKATTNASTKDFAEMGKMIKDVAVETGFASKDVAQFATTLGRMGVEAKNISLVGKAAAQMAKITGADLNKAGEVVVQTMNAFNKNFSDAEYYVTSMVNTINGSALTLEKYSTIMGYVSAAAYETGMSFESVNAAVAVLANSGLKASTIGTSLRNILGKMTGDGEDLLDVIKKLKDGTFSYADAVEKVGQRGANALALLVDKYDEVIEIQNRARVQVFGLGNRVGIVQESPFVQIEKATNRIETLLQFLAQGTVKQEEITEQLQSLLGADKASLVAGGVASSSAIPLLKPLAEGYRYFKWKSNKQFAEDLMAGVLQTAASDAVASIGEEAENMTTQQIKDTISNTVKNKLSEDEVFLKAAQVTPGETIEQIAERAVKASTDAIENVSFNDARRAAIKRFISEYDKGDKFAEYGEMWSKDMSDMLTQYMLEEMGQRGVPLKKLSKEEGRNMFAETGIIEYGQTTSEMKGRMRVLQEGMNAFSGKSEMNKAEMKEYDKYKEEYDKLKALFCKYIPTNTEFCKKETSSGSKPKLETLEDLFAAMGDLSMQDAIDSAKDRIELLKQARQREIDAIQDFEDSAEYSAKKDEIDARYDKQWMEIYNKLLKEGVDGNLDFLEQLDLRQLESIKKEGLERIERRAEQFAKIWKGTEGTIEYSNEKRKMEAQNSKFIQAVDNAILKTSGGSAVGERQLRTMVSSGLRDKAGFGIGAGSYVGQKADMAEVIADLSIAYATGAAEGELSLAQLASVSKDSFNPFKKMGINVKSKKQSREMWKQRVAQAGELKLAYQSQGILADSAYEEKKTLAASERERIAKKRAELAGLDPASALIQSDYNGSKTKKDAERWLKEQEDLVDKQLLVEESKYKREKTTINKNIATASKAELEADPTIKSKEEKFGFAMGLTQDVLTAGIDMYQDYQDRMLQATLDRIQKEIDAERSKADEQQTLLDGALELGLISQSDYAAKNKEIEDSYREKEKVAQKKAFEEEKKAEKKSATVQYASDMAQMAINTLVAASSAGAAAPIYYAIQMAVNSAIMGAQYGMKMKAINEKEFIPKRYATGGILEGASHSRGGIPFSIGGKLGFEAEGGEYLINKYSTKKYAREIEAINNDTFDKQQYNNSDVVNLLKVIAAQGSSPVRAFITSQDLRTSESARKMFDSKIKING